MKNVVVLNLSSFEPLEESCTDDGLGVALYLMDQGIAVALSAEPGSPWEFLEDLSSAQLIEWLMETLDARRHLLEDQALLDAGLGSADEAEAS